MVVLDTTFIIHFLNNKQTAIKKAEQFSNLPCTTRVNIFEVLVGIYLKNPEETEAALAIFYNFLRQVKILELDSKSADVAAKISAELNKTGKTVSKTDILIAAIALANNETTILTQNVKDFSRIKGVKVENY